MKNYSFLFALSVAFVAISCAPAKTTNAIISGIAWFDQNNNEVNAHASCVVEENGVFYLFGESHTDDSNEYTGINCYSSSDLVNWKFENKVLGLQDDGLLGPGRVGERAKVMRCPQTGEYVMFMHTDDLKYNDPHVGYAVSDKIDGDYTFMGELKYRDSYIRRWDLSVYKDNDGTGYVLTHEGNIYRLAPDYRSVDSVLVSEIVPGGEAPVMIKDKGTYYWMFSNKTSWERNDNFYYTASSLGGPWEKRGLFCPEGKTTWNSQAAFALPIVSATDTLYVFMGDRWSYPKQESAATYVWQPMTIGEDGISIPEFQPAWALDIAQASWKPVDMRLKKVKNSEIETGGIWDVYDGEYESNVKGATLSCVVEATRIAVYGVSDNHSGYAKITVSDLNGEKVLDGVIDFYSQYHSEGVKFLSPVLERGKYRVSVEVMATWAECYDKRGNHYGSDNGYVNVSGVAIER